MEEKEVVGVGFDWSGTLCDDLVTSHRAAWLLAKQLGITIEHDPEMWGSHPSSSPKAEFEARIARGDTTLQYMTPEEYTTLYRDMYDRVSMVPPIKPGIGSAVPILMCGVIDVLRRLHQFRRRDNHKPLILFIVSACPTVSLVRDINRFGINDIFTDVLGDTSDKAAAITSILQKYTLDPKKVWYVGDTTGDIAAAKKAGVIPVGVTTGYHTKQMVITANPAITLTSVVDMLPYFQ